VEQSPWQANGSSANQEIPHILWNPKFHYRIHKSRDLSLSWARSIQSTPPYLISSGSISIQSSHLCLGITSSSFPHFSCPYMCYMPGPSHSSRFHHPNNIWWALQIIKLLIIQISPLPFYLVPLSPKYFPQHPILKHTQPACLPQCERPSFTPI